MNVVIRDWPKERIYFVLIILFSIPVFLLNLGSPAFIEDESIRGLVALEMELSGNFIAPTLNGEYYFKKPPLWNWILIGFFNLTGDTNEFSARLATLLFLYLFGLSIYITFKRHLPEKQAILNALLFLTCGRILFWDSLLALIDLCFSWVIFMLFIWIYEQHRRSRYLSLYLGAYAIATIAFMLKALPALVFLGFTLLAVQINAGTWKKLFSWQHFAGIGLFVSALSGYLLLYNQYFPIENLLSVFVDESTQRTAIEYGFLNSLMQVFTFPVEMIYHFLPWSLICLLFFSKHAFKRIKQQAFVSFLALTFAANIWIYWTSPEVFPRYLFMLTPLYFGVGIYLYQDGLSKFFKRCFDISMLLLGCIVCFGSAIVLFVEPTKSMAGLWWKWGVPFSIMLCFLFIMFKQPNYRILAFVAFLVAARLGFDLIVLPSRGVHSELVQTRADAVRIGEKWHDEQLYLYRYDSMKYEASFYLTATRKQILHHTPELIPGAYHLVNPLRYPILISQHQKIDSLKISRPEDKAYLIHIPQ
ncbi:MAG: phospholipid carrier-dependent glycosyltransferase [Saprospiraceae bacterium]|nr:phospholipid carrier-dependent glycosyltransferase [Saprospiraceae bacterium]